LGIPSGEVQIDWNTVVFSMLTIKGIYGREMFETWYKMTVLVQTGLDSHAGHHPPLSFHRVREGLRCHALRQVGQGHFDLEGRLSAVFGIAVRD